MSFGEGDGRARREVKVWHRKFRNGRGISLFFARRARGKAQAAEAL